MNEKEQLIKVRDRREKHQFSIHNRVIDEWLPIIGLPGLALYALYVRMSNKKDEKCYPGYTLIQEHLGMGRATISNYNKLLQWCGLIHIEPGDAVNTNDYYILDIPTVTPEALDRIRSMAVAKLSESSKFRRLVLDRLTNWQPIHWQRNNKSNPNVVHPEQLTLTGGSPVAEHPSSPAEHPSSVAEHPSSPGELEQSEATIRKNNPQQQQAPAQIQAQQAQAQVDAVVAANLEALARFGVITSYANTREVAGLPHVTPNLIRAWGEHLRQQEKVVNVPGLLLDTLKTTKAPPPAGRGRRGGRRGDDARWPTKAEQETAWQAHKDGLLALNISPIQSITLPTGCQYL